MSLTMIGGVRVYPVNRVMLQFIRFSKDDSIGEVFVPLCKVGHIIVFLGKKTLSYIASAV